MARASEPPRTHLQLNSQSYTTFLEMRQAINQYLKARKGFKLMERDDQRTSISFTRKARKAREKETTSAKESTKARAKERPSKMRKERVLGKASRINENSKVLAGIVARQDTVRRRNLVT